MSQPASKLSIVTREVGDVTVLVLVGIMLLDDGEVSFRDQIHQLLSLGRRKIVVDLGGVTYIDSAGMGMLVAKRQTVQLTGGDIKLVHVPAKQQRALELMRVASVFEVYEDEDAAVSSFKT